MWMPGVALAEDNSCSMMGRLRLRSIAPSRVAADAVARSLQQIRIVLRGSESATAIQMKWMPACIWFWFFGGADIGSEVLGVDAIGEEFHLAEGTACAVTNRSAAALLTAVTVSTR